MPPEWSGGAGARKKRRPERRVCDSPYATQMKLPDRPLLCYVTDRRALPTPGEMTRREEIVRIARAAIRAGVDWVQIREKDLPTQGLLEMTRQMVAAAEGSAAKILVNDRLDVALTAGTAGVHLGGESMPVAAARKLSTEVLGPGRAFLVGRSCHSLEEAEQTEHDGADYIFFGPVFVTPSKAQHGPPQGVERLAEACRAVRIPVIAIGGIDLGNAAECFRAGAAGIAAIRLFQEAADLAAVVGGLRP